MCECCETEGRKVGLQEKGQRGTGVPLRGCLVGAARLFYGDTRRLGWFVETKAGANVMKEVVRWAGSGGGQQRKGDQESIGEGPEEGPRRSGVGRPWAETELRARRDAGPCCCQSASPGWVHTARPATQHKQGHPPCHASLRHRVTTNAGNVTAATQPCRSRWTTRQGSLSLLFSQFDPPLFTLGMTSMRHLRGPVKAEVA